MISGVPPASDERDPAFPLDLPWTRTEFANLKPFEPVWANQHWKRLAGGQSLLDCLTLDSMRKLGDWLTGAQDPKVRQRLARSQGWKKAEWAPGAPGPGHLNDVGDLVHRSNGDGGMYESLGKLDSPEPPGGVANASLNLKFAFASGPVQLQLSKTSLPIYQNQDPTRTLMTTHTFAVVTATPVPDISLESLTADDRPEYVASRSSSQHRDSPPVHSNGSSGTGATSRPHASLTRTSPEEKANTRDHPAQKDVHGQSEHGQPLRFRAGAAVPVPTSQTSTTGGKHLSVSELLDKTNWASTPLGPREQWGTLLNGMVTYVMNYPLPASIWWGKALTLIYNEHYANEMCNHPQVFGQSDSASWAGTYLPKPSGKAYANSYQSCGRAWDP